ncbi:IS1634 family transposase [Nostoc sp. 'Peltigera membranacea cyanobiont' N6]|uniref:IS1634 family transposase n=1 Tax=Nostoc sp. 'Peltigera membranacea cyanobiont' N6 TaxID=1261031 RepID=UPI000CF3571E|nr:IS1634 family transposase [Nostoc sp. 'Peltigera membranacea cyanobiont' N6]AVH63802.1 transposase [Nostoc sp. 'Peltigera membranacea cyanobiont' N6]
MSNHQEIEFKNIDHLGIIAGIIDSIGLVEIINKLIGQEAGEKISAGHVVKAMILNGLGFVSSPLYMFPEFFQDKPCEHLIGKGVKAEYLNDDKLGRVMDKLFIKGLTEIFLAISSQVIKEFNISLKSSHLDSTSLHLHGEYKTSLPDVTFDNNSSNCQIKSPQAIEITYGYSRDHRPDLKQFIIDLISSGDGDIPIFLKMIMGLCLLVYTLAQRQIRAALSASKSTIKNQLGKAINNPTMRWVFQCFQSIHLVKLNNQEIFISNMTSSREYILSFLPDNCRHYYKC